jgi:hypothetical protein
MAIYAVGIVAANANATVAQVPFTEFRLLNSALKDFGIQPMRASRLWSHNSERRKDPP